MELERKAMHHVPFFTEFPGQDYRVGSGACSICGMGCNDAKTDKHAKQSASNAVSVNATSGANDPRSLAEKSQTACTFTVLRTLATDILRQTRIPGDMGREHCPAKIEYMQADVQRPIRLLTNKK
jgi:hypothetical protein